MVSKKKIEPKEVALNLTWKDVQRLKKKWPEVSNSVDSVEIVNILTFYEPDERIHFVNELFRVMKKDAKAHIVQPHWASARANGDLAFKYPPVAETWFHHLNEEWRKANAPWGTKYRCDFDFTQGYGLHPEIGSRPHEYQTHAVMFWKEAAQDIHATLIKR